jgi:hypothetical protein
VPSSSRQARKRAAIIRLFRQSWESPPQNLAQHLGGVGLVVAGGDDMSQPDGTAFGHGDEQGRLSRK